MLDVSKIRAIGLDLDDTLWPVWPTIERADAQMSLWLSPRAPATVALLADPDTRLRLREEVVRSRPELRHNLSAVRREFIRLALERAGEDGSLAEPAFEVFFEHRMRVDLFDDALPALEFLAGRFPIVAISNGNADVVRVGLGAHFKASMGAHECGFAKPDIRIFHAAAAALDVRPDQMLHVGDDPELDVLGGLDAGMQTVWLNRAERDWEYASHPHASVADLQALCRLLGRTP